MRQPVVAANWKMNGRRDMVTAYSDALKKTGPYSSDITCVVCPPCPYLVPMGDRLGASQGVELGAQNLAAWRGDGAYTGEVSGAMLFDVGVRWVIVGHSERRRLLQESDSIVSAKFSAAVAARIRPILCVGESSEDRESGQAEAKVRRQLESVLDTVGMDAFRHAVIAYEPLWAIGTGRTASPESAQKMHKVLRHAISARSREVGHLLPIIYGGSVKPDNAQALFEMDDIDGALVGGASLDPADFARICRVAMSLAQSDNA